MFQNYPKIWKYHVKSNQGFNFLLWPKSFLRPSLCRKMNRFNLKRRIKRRFLIMQCSFRCYCDKFLMCSVGAKPIQYNLLPHSSSLHSMSCTASIEGGLASSRSSFFYGETDSDLVPLKITLLGDSHIGKTSFLEKYVGNQNEAEDGTKKGGLRTMDKTLYARGARISYRMWEVDGEEKSQVSAACIDSMAILFMFDLTSRCTLNNIISWYRQARRWNQKAIPIMIGTKFDDFIQLPLDLQWEIASQARGYAKLLNATLFFSSATYNINVNKIFKFITAKLFDLPWTVERNLTIGEPIIDF